jgi:23S rRNA pseudouridine1911/1915/1917 synthase
MKNFDQVWFFHSPLAEPEINPQISTIFDNQDICIFSKPPNLVVHAAGLYLKNTFIEHISKIGFENCSPVHRIDRETSGILICARQMNTRKILSDAFRHSQVHKMYLAVTKGTRELPEQFVVTSPIGEPENSAIRLKLWIYGKNPQPARTNFVKLAQVNDYTLFACLPVTGRTNQIRIHLSSIGHWIVGDKMYHENESVFIEFFEKGFTQWVHENVLFPRHLLHNTGIMFDKELEIDPLSFGPIICPLPKDMLEFSYTNELMKKANIPLENAGQVDALKKIFLNVHEIDFSEAESIDGF